MGDNDFDRKMADVCEDRVIIVQETLTGGDILYYG